MSITSVPAFLGVELPPSFSLLGRRAFVTGGSRGIGKACALALASAGADIAVGSSSAGAADAEAVCAKIREMGRRAEAFSFDVRARGEVELMCGRVTESLKGIDILVNNAGVTKDAMLHKMTHEQWDDVVRIDLSSMFYMCRPLIDGMRERNFGRIINISSINGQKGQMGQTNYSAAKAGIIGFTKALAQETAKKGITVNVICPGYIDTEMVQAVPEKVLQGIIATIPVGRLGKADEIAKMVCFLAGDDAAFITGATMTVNGAQYIAG